MLMLHVNATYATYFIHAILHMTSIYKNETCIVFGFFFK